MNNWYKDKIVKCICECGKEFTAYKCNKRKYCSLECANKSIGNKKKEKRVKLVCEYCGKEYDVIQSRVKKSKYCSRECRDIHFGILHTAKNNPNYKEKITLICFNCNEEYEINDYIKDISKFCSIECKAEYQKESQQGKNNPNFGNRKYTDLEYKNWQEYQLRARAESYATYRLYKNEINPENLKIGKCKHHLDHKYSIHDGFHNDVPIEIISHPYNLQILFCKENLKKNKNSCITLSELIGEI